MIQWHNHTLTVRILREVMTVTLTSPCAWLIITFLCLVCGTAIILKALKVSEEKTKENAREGEARAKAEEAKARAREEEARAKAEEARARARAVKKQQECCIS